MQYIHKNVLFLHLYFTLFPSKVVYRYTSEDKRLWRYWNNNDYKIEDRLNIVTSQTETGMVITTAVLAVSAVNA